MVMDNIEEADQRLKNVPEDVGEKYTRIEGCINQSNEQFDQILHSIEENSLTFN